MKALFGIVSLVVALALAGVLVAKQSKTALAVLPVSAPAESGASSVPAAGSSNVREQSQQLQQRVRDDVAKALEQGAATRRNEADH